ncbi:MAG: HAD family hydrolase [Candidatus Latescibacteria bacterium]|nr:HAD family hydrolase [Gemmatimonadaceae bacterium]MDP6018726.1 HAD family hydrolase [Candidatus Latescibacterota bacterium]
MRRPSLFRGMLRSVIFDLDCTLADRSRSIDAYLQPFLDRFGKALDTADPKVIRETLGRADGNGYAADTRAADIIAGIDWSRPPRAATVDKHWHLTFPGCAVAMEDAHDVLDELREEGLSLGILTNGTVAAQEAKIARLGLDERVDAVIVSEAVGVKKPDARIFEAVLEALDMDADDAVYVGDHPVNDVQGATDAGLTAIWMRGWQEWPDDLPPAELFVDRLAEVPPLLASLPDG